MNYNVTGNSERECLKIIKIGQSAAKHLLNIILDERSTTIENTLLIMEVSRVHSSEWKHVDFF